MSKTLIALFIAAGVGAFAYTKLANRVGYGNNQSVWTLVGISSLVAFLIIFSALTFIIHLH